ncbi:cutinase-domain-containing protein [Eremomyces bilateralis CBS 781.70]|uniref:Cutinase n=1 Tax=Eremomyces bilateralis CBS 781.70 TaxID=1392243 RepID=A0A6G1GGQ1_9PEZI|nr:cutinase-domain-containing protein [Eremomyces bilateralis CBS 781.70]KAF1817049.1 cutinase-domain-containing protein [Eremomyces bilateralis CBS 781.70]
MKYLNVVAALAALAIANPLPSPAAAELEAQFENAHELVKRQGSTSNELNSGACRDYIFIFARGSTESGNMGGTVGPATCSGLKNSFGSSRVACQGVGPQYTASIGDNLLSEGTSSAGYNNAITLFNLAQSKCPQSLVVFGGYSQGAAVMHASVRRLSASSKARLVGGVLYGDTRNGEDNGQIPNYPRDDVLIICRADDGVCGAGLTVTLGHLLYTTDGSVTRGVGYLANKIRAGA